MIGVTFSADPVSPKDLRDCTLKTNLLYRAASIAEGGTLRMHAATIATKALISAGWIEWMIGKGEIKDACIRLICGYKNHYMHHVIVEMVRIDDPPEWTILNTEEWMGTGKMPIAFQYMEPSVALSKASAAKKWREADIPF
jgi:hypothetical protein